jgi:hypothetical protein|tara:strand:+ start:1379 stop:1522 length:144 start_codon:yes stop_codon:yes gene_type:complete
MEDYYGWNMWEMSDGSWQAQRPDWENLVITANNRFQMMRECRRWGDE